MQTEAINFRAEFSRAGLHYFMLFHADSQALAAEHAAHVAREAGYALVPRSVMRLSTGLFDGYEAGVFHKI